jgi:hypothetical protein
MHVWPGLPDGGRPRHRKKTSVVNRGQLAEERASIPVFELVPDGQLERPGQRLCFKQGRIIF